jgi:hypothetical protein
MSTRKLQIFAKCLCICWVQGNQETVSGWGIPVMYESSLSRIHVPVSHVAVKYLLSADCQRTFLTLTEWNGSKPREFTTKCTSTAQSISHTSKSIQQEIIFRQWFRPQVNVAMAKSKKYVSHLPARQSCTLTHTTKSYQPQPEQEGTPEWYQDASQQQDTVDERCMCSTFMLVV